MIYLCVAFSCVWLVNLFYLFTLDLQARNLRRRLEARAGEHG